MRAPAFWQRQRPTTAARLLSPLGAIYGAVVARRMAGAGKAVSTPVICVGNFTVGGAGKTPVAIALAQMLIEDGHAPAFLSRGYGGAHNGPPLRVDPALHTAAHVGDEPLLLARVAPTFVGKDRAAGAQAAIAAGADVIVMDDGLQNAALRKDLSFAVIDAVVGFGNGLCLPAGPLRAPIAAQMPRVDALVIVGESDMKLHDAKPIYHAHVTADAEIAATLHGARVVAFAGIGRPEKFFATLDDIGAVTISRRAFADHHQFSPTELDGLLREAAAAGAQLVTTEKDFARLPASFAATALPVRLEFAEPQAIRDKLRGALLSLKASH